jgi:hypothetical protein
MASQRFAIFFSFQLIDRRILAILSVVITLLVIENVDAIVADFLVAFNTSMIGITVFVIISSGYLGGQFILLKLIRAHSDTIRSRSKMIANSLRAVTIIQYSLACNLIILIGEVLIFSKYSTLSLIIVSFVSNIFTAVLFILFSLRFIAWYKERKQSLGVLLYSIAFLILAVSQLVAGFGDSYLLSQKDQIISPTSKVQFYDFSEGSFFNEFYDYYAYLDYASFLLTLLASGLLLYHYSKKTNKPKMAFIIFLPILSYSSSILDSLNIYDTDTSPDLFSYYIFASLIRTLSGILFAISFWFVAKRLPDSPIKTFLKITAYGFILLYVANHSSVIVAPYPPFGMISLSVLSLSSYYLLFGLYSSALSLSQDITLRNHLRSMARNDNNLLSSIGTAQMETEVKRAINELKEVADVEEKELAEKTGVETPIAKNEVEDYLKQVIEEVARSRKK